MSEHEEISTESEIKMTEFELEEAYDAMLDDSYDTIDICGYHYSPSRALKLVDPTAYRCGLLDFEDMMERDREMEDA